VPRAAQRTRRGHAQVSRLAKREGGREGTQYTRGALCALGGGGARFVRVRRRRSGWSLQLQLPGRAERRLHLTRAR
jgi:hypothetical protein